MTKPTGDAISAEEWELVAFFGELPEEDVEDQPWPYVERVFNLQRADLVVSFAVMPAYRDVRIRLLWRGDPIYELNALRVGDVRYRRDELGERLEIELGDRSQLTLRVEPNIFLDHQQAEPDV